MNQYHKQVIQMANFVQVHSKFVTILIIEFHIIFLNF
jgi:hypothetical protein